MKYPELIIWELRTQKLLQACNRLYLARLNLTRFLALEGLQTDELITVAQAVESFPGRACIFAADRISPDKLPRLKQLIAAVTVPANDSARYRSNIPRPLRGCMFIGSN